MRGRNDTPRMRHRGRTTTDGAKCRAAALKASALPSRRRQGGGAPAGERGCLAWRLLLLLAAGWWLMIVRELDAPVCPKFHNAAAIIACRSLDQAGGRLEARGFS
jgi:hypothetical protein